MEWTLMSVKNKIKHCVSISEQCLSTIQTSTMVFIFLSILKWDTIFLIWCCSSCSMRRRGLEMYLDLAVMFCHYVWFKWLYLKLRLRSMLWKRLQFNITSMTLLTQCSFLKVVYYRLLLQKNVFSLLCMPAYLWESLWISEGH